MEKKFGKISAECNIISVLAGFDGFCGFMRDGANSAGEMRATCEKICEIFWEISPCVNVSGRRDIGQSRERRGAIPPICLNTKFWR